MALTEKQKDKLTSTGKKALSGAAGAGAVGLGLGIAKKIGQKNSPQFGLTEAADTRAGMLRAKLKSAQAPIDSAMVEQRAEDTFQAAMGEGQKSQAEALRTSLAGGLQGGDELRAFGQISEKGMEEKAKAMREGYKTAAEEKRKDADFAYNELKEEEARLNKERQDKLWNKIPRVVGAGGVALNKLAESGFLDDVLGVVGGIGGGIVGVAAGPGGIAAGAAAGQKSFKEFGEGAQDFINALGDDKEEKDSEAEEEEDKPAAEEEKPAAEEEKPDLAPYVGGPALDDSRQGKPGVPKGLDPVTEEINTPEEEEVVVLEPGEPLIKPEVSLRSEAIKKRLGGKKGSMGEKEEGELELEGFEEPVERKEPEDELEEVKEERLPDQRRKALQEVLTNRDKLPEFPLGSVLDIEDMNEYAWEIFGLNDPSSVNAVYIATGFRPPNNTKVSAAELDRAKAQAEEKGTPLNKAMKALQSAVKKGTN